jgi:hypothetical protein
VGVGFPGGFVCPFFCVAFDTGDLGVGPMKGKTRLTVVKVFLVYISGIMTPTFVVVVTGNTRTLCQSVKRLLLTDRFFDLHVAVQAFAVRYPLPCVMALKAIPVL